MKNEHCIAIVQHISRIEGQLKRLKKDVEEHENCENIARLSLSAAKSFDSLRAKIIEGYISQKGVLEAQELDALIQLAKA